MAQLSLQQIENMKNLVGVKRVAQTVTAEFPHWSFDASNYPTQSVLMVVGVEFWDISPSLKPTLFTYLNSTTPGAADGTLVNYWQDPSGTSARYWHAMHVDGPLRRPLPIWLFGSGVYDVHWGNAGQFGSKTVALYYQVVTG